MKGRAVWYTSMSAYESSDMSKERGTVSVAYSGGMTQQALQKMIETLTHSGNHVMELPNRFASIHFCYDSFIVKPGMSLFQMVMGKQNRLHFRSHYGSVLEVVYALHSFGISIDQRMLEENEEFQQRYYDDYIAKRRKIEAAAKEKELQLSRTGTVLYASANDVLLGRGRPYQEFSGNQVLAQYVEEACGQYQQLEHKFEKSRLSMMIAEKIQAGGGRFLLRKKDCWEVAPDDAVHSRISQALRVKSKSRVKSSPVLSRNDVSSTPIHLGEIVENRTAKRTKLAVESAFPSDILNDDLFM